MPMYKSLRLVTIAALFTLLACSLYVREYRTADLKHRTVFIGVGGFIHSPHGLRVQDANSSVPLFTLNDAEFIRANPLYGESEPTRNSYVMAAALFSAIVSVVTLLL